MHKLENEALIICTSGRPKELQATCNDLVRCSTLPETLIFIEGNLGNSLITHILLDVSSRLDRFGIHVIHKQTRAHLTHQRNFGIRHTPQKTRIIHFIDDDLSPSSFYFSEISEHLNVHRECVMAGGFLKSVPRQTEEPSAFRRFFLLDAKCPGKYLFSGQTSQFQNNATLKGKEFYQTDWLSGCCMSFRSSLFNRIAFDESLVAEGMDEDLDISRQAAEYGELHVIPAARCDHRWSPDNRASAGHLLERKIINRWYILSKHRPSVISKIAYLWSCLGIFLALHYNHSEVSDLKMGFMRGFRQILKNGILTKSTPVSNPKLATH